MFPPYLYKDVNTFVTSLNSLIKLEKDSELII